MNSKASFLTNITFSCSPDIEPLELRLLDKILLLLVWTISLGYSILSPQLLSHHQCLVREDLFSPLGTISLIFALIGPLIIGPGAAIITIFGISIINLCSGRKVYKAEANEHIPCLAFLTFLLIFTYSINMVISELYFDNINSIMWFILIKYGLGTSHQLLGPLVIISCYKDIRLSVINVFMKGGTNQNESKDITDEEMKKELGHL